MAGTDNSVFLKPKFIASLYQKLCELRAGAKSTGGNSLYSALHFYRYWFVERAPLTEMLESIQMEGTQGKSRKRLEELRNRLQAILDSNDAHCQKCEKLLAAETLRIYQTGDLAAHQRIGAVFVRHVRHERANYKRLDWPECFCAVALQSLIKGIVPTKKKVREAAFREMAIRLLPAGPGEQAIRAKIKTLRKYGPKRPDRIFAVLGLSQLPESPSRPGVAYRD
jgi:hypothetical protein